MAALLAPLLQDLLSPGGSHAIAETVRLSAPAAVRLIGSLQYPCSLSEIYSEGQTTTLT